RIPPVPERQREGEAALAIADPEESVLTPAVGAAAGVVVRKVVPRRARRGVVLAHGAPLPLGEVRTPALPVTDAQRVVRQPLILRPHATRHPRPPPGCIASSARYEKSRGRAALRASRGSRADRAAACRRR